MSAVVANAIHLLGDERDLRHVAPRVIADVVDGSATDETWYLKRFRDAGFADWPEAERRAVTDVLDAAWKRRLATFDPTGHEVEGLLCGIGHVLLDLAPLLDAWGRRTDRVAVANLASSMVLDAGTLTRGGTPDGAWWDEDAPDDGAVRRVAAGAGASRAGGGGVRRQRRRAGRDARPRGTAGVTAP